MRSDRCSEHFPPEGRRNIIDVAAWRRVPGGQRSSRFAETPSTNTKERLRDYFKTCEGKTHGLTRFVHAAIPPSLHITKGYG